MNENPILTSLGFITLVLFVIYLINPDFFKRKVPATTANKPSTDEVKCQMRSKDGQVITLTGKADDTNFKEMCEKGNQEQQTQTPVYYPNYPNTPFYYYRYYYPQYYRWNYYPNWNRIGI